jgi:hypothetical protein
MSKRRKAVARVHVPIPDNRSAILATFGEGGSNGWDLWVPDRCAVSSVKQQGGGTLIRLVPKP